MWASPARRRGVDSTKQGPRTLRAVTDPTACSSRKGGRRGPDDLRPMTLEDLAPWEAMMDPGGSLDLLLDVVCQRPAWMADGACREHLEVEFVATPPRNGRPPKADKEAALAVCRSCLVRPECLAFAVEHGEVGVWGGTTERERRRLRRQGAA